MMTRKTYRLGMRAIALSLACYLSNTATNAAPYASDLTNSSGVVSFRLNENADNVKIIVGGVTNDIGPGYKGLTNVNVGIAGITKVVVTRTAAVGYTQTSDDAYLDPNGVYVNKFEQPRGVAVDRNPASPSFGRIYVANGRAGSASTGSPARTTYQGIYMINSDDSVALDTGVTPRTAGLPFAVSGTGSPGRLFINPDDNRLYMSDVSDSAGGVWVSDLNVLTNAIATNVLGTIGDPGATNSPATNNHGSVYGVAVSGSQAGSNLKVFTSDEDLSPVRSLWRYDVGSGALPYVGSKVGPIQTCTINQTALDVTKGGVNKYVYYSQNRSSGTEPNGPNIRIVQEDGTLVTTSQDASRTFLGNPSAADLYKNVLAIDISADGNTLAAVQGSDFGGRVMVIPLTNGVFNFAASNVFAIAGLSGSTTAQNNTRDIAIDAAGNIYLINTFNEWFRIYSKGGPTEAVTGTDGTFTIGVPSTLVTVAATTANTLEGSATNGVFTFTRTGDTSGSLTVNFALSGTATSPADYSISSTNVTFAPGQSTATVTITPVNDSIAQLKRTVILTILGGSSYSGGVPSSATVTILDDETPSISITAVQPKLLEGYSASKATFTVTRRGLVKDALTIPVTYPGAAIVGTHFTGASSVSFGAGVQTATLTLTPIDDEIYQGERISLVQLNAGSGYVLATNSSEILTLVDDEFPTTGSPLFSDNFNTVSANSSPNWTITSGDGFADSHADFGFDYTTLYVTPLPGAGDTRALKLQVTNAIFGSVVALGLSPQGLNLGTNDYRLKFKMWINYNGPMFDGGSGSSFHLTTGAGTSEGAIPLDGASFAMDGDGGTHGTVIGDCNAYLDTNLQQDDSGVYAAGTSGDPRVTTNAFYSLWGGLTAPATQLSHYSSQSGTSGAGNLGVSWHTVTLSKSGNTVTWYIDGVVIATIVASDPSSLKQNVSIGYEDLFPSASESSNPTMSFALVDNLKVENYVAVPPVGPKIYNVQKSGNNIVLSFVGGSSDVPGNFTVLGSSTLSSSGASYTPVGGQSITGANGVFQATVPFSAGTKFYRIQR